LASNAFVMRGLDLRIHLFRKNDGLPGHKASRSDAVFDGYARQ
jgi:hypothetical protein